MIYLSFFAIGRFVAQQASPIGFRINCNFFKNNLHGLFPRYMEYISSNCILVMLYFLGVANLSVNIFQKLRSPPQWEKGSLHFES